MKDTGATRTETWRTFPASILLAFLPLIALPAYPDTDTLEESDYEAAPARIRALEGSAMLQRQMEQDRVEATINAPLFPGDHLKTDDGRAEVEFPDGSILWLDSGTWVELLGIRDPQGETSDSTVLRLHQGVLEADSRNDGTASGEDPRIDTEEASVYLLGRGRFRIESDRGTTTVVSLRGVAELAGDEGSVLVRSGQKSEVVRGSVPDEPRAVNTLRMDDFDDWCEERLSAYLSDDDAGDREYVRAVPAPVRHYVTELDNYGDWQWMVSFGWVWRPTIYQAGWRPYYNGYWSWHHRGWTWVAYEPWGWMPYHYGRWNWSPAFGYVWIPGGVYSGAWVSWAVTPSYVGWCPLDYYNRPAYVNVNVTNVTVNNYGGGWNFLPLNRMADRNAPRHIVKPERVPNLHGAVTTRVLPRFSPEQVRARPELARQVVRDSARSQYRLDLADRGNRQGLASFREADQREAGLQREGTKERRTPAATVRPRPSAPATQLGERVTKPRPATVAPRKNPEASQQPRAVPGPSRGAGAQEGRGQTARPSREKDRPAVPQGQSGPGVIRKEPRPPSEGTKVRPRREPTPAPAPQEPEEPSRRVLNRIFDTGGGSTGTPRTAARPRDEKSAPDRGQAAGQKTRDSQPRQSRPQAAAKPGRSQQAPRAETPPPRKQEGEKKDKP